MLLTLAFAAGTMILPAQHQDPAWSARRAIIDAQCVQNDSLCNVLHKLGTFEGHLRSFLMTTHNGFGNPDYYALAMGGGLAYFSPVIKNFQVGMSGFIIYNVASSPLAPTVPYNNRYEIGLFDINDPDNHQDLDRLEDLYVRYYVARSNRSYVQAGKFHLRTPLINLQDGRMRPNLQQGIWVEWNEWQRWKLKGGWISKTSPRSTVHWFDVGESIGQYPSGRATNGAKSQYAGHVQTPGIAIAGVTVLPAKGINMQVWNYRVPRLFNTSWVKAEYTRKRTAAQWMFGTQYLFQQSLYNDTLSVERQYINANETAHALSTRVARTNVLNGSEWSLSWTRITSRGRFLFPREWGVEPFYTFMYRERVEGAGDVHALMLQNQRAVGPHQRLTLQMQAGAYWMPSIDNALLNKYAMPGYYHFNLRARQRFTGFLHGLQADVLYSYKGLLAKPVPFDEVVYHNKAKTHLLSVVLDYYF